MANQESDDRLVRFAVGDSSEDSSWDDSLRSERRVSEWSDSRKQLTARFAMLGYSGRKPPVASCCNMLTSRLHRPTRAVAIVHCRYIDERELLT